MAVPSKTIASTADEDDVSRSSGDKHTVTFFNIGDHVQLDSVAGYGNVDATLISIGRRYLVLKLDNGRVVHRIWPSWIRTST